MNVALGVLIQSLGETLQPVEFPNNWIFPNNCILLWRVCPLSWSTGSTIPPNRRPLSLPWKHPYRFSLLIRYQIYLITRLKPGFQTIGSSDIKSFFSEDPHISLGVCRTLNLATLLPVLGEKVLPILFQGLDNFLKCPPGPLRSSFGQCWWGLDHGWKQLYSRGKTQGWMCHYVPP